LVYWIAANAFPEVDFRMLAGCELGHMDAEEEGVEHFKWQL
jgi:hypothetical protein